MTVRLAHEQSTGSFTDWVSMAEQLQPRLTSPSTMQSVGCSGVEREATKALKQGLVTARGVLCQV